MASVTTAPAIITPSAMHSMAQRLRMPKINAATVPVHAPVTGSGIATKSVSPIASYFSTTAALRRVRLNIHVKKRSHRRNRRNF